MRVTGDGATRQKQNARRFERRKTTPTPDKNGGGGGDQNKETKKKKTRKLDGRTFGPPATGRDDDDDDEYTSSADTVPTDHGRTSRLAHHIFVTGCDVPNADATRAGSPTLSEGVPRRRRGRRKPNPPHRPLHPRSTTALRC